MCVASPCLPHVGVCSQPAPASQLFMVLLVWSIIRAALVNADGLSVPGDVLWGATGTGEGARALSWVGHQSTSPRAAFATPAVSR